MWNIFQNKSDIKFEVIGSVGHLSLMFQTRRRTDDVAMWLCLTTLGSVGSELSWETVEDFSGRRWEFEEREREREREEVPFGLRRRRRYRVPEAARAHAG